MSADVENIQEDLGASGVPGSLHARMRARAKELEAQRTEIFPVPGYAQVLAVELRPLDWDTISKRAAALEKVTARDPALGALYFAADQLVAATVGFYEVLEDGRRNPIDTSWVGLANGVRDQFPEDGTPRMAILALFSEPTSKLIMFVEQFQAWANGERNVITEELARDFEMTR